MSWAIYRNEFARSPWRELYCASTVGIVLSLIVDRQTGLSLICGRSWARILADVGPLEALRIALAPTSLSALFMHWGVMLLAMMPPLLAQPVVHVLRSTRRTQRARGLASLACGYGLVWMCAGPLLVSLALIFTMLSVAWAALATALLALLWSSSPWHQVALNRSHQVRRLGIFGWRSDRDVFIYGATHGLWCFSACWIWMLLPLLTPDFHVPVMLLASAMMLAERIYHPAVPRWRIPRAIELLAAIIPRISILLIQPPRKADA